MDQTELKNRTKLFAQRVVRLCRCLPENSEGRLIGNQIFRSATSVAANYRAACRARSTAEFVAKLGIVEEEADETLFWLEMIVDLQILDKELLAPLMQENDEIIAITVSTIKSTRKNMP